MDDQIKLANNRKSKGTIIKNSSGHRRKNRNWRKSLITEDRKTDNFNPFNIYILKLYNGFIVVFCKLNCIMGIQYGVTRLCIIAVFAFMLMTAYCQNTKYGAIIL